MTVPLLQVKSPLTSIVETINTLLRGRANNVGEVTLTDSVTTTTVTDTRIKTQMKVYLAPRTANAAAALTNVYISSVDDGSFTLTHASAASTDRTFDYVFHGG